MTPAARWLTAAIACLILAAALPAAYAYWLVTSYARHDCQALNVINRAPVQRPHPGYKAQQEVWELHLGLVNWARANGC